MNNFISYCSSCLSCCPPFQNQNNGTLRSGMNPAKETYDGLVIECQLVTISIVNSNQRIIEEIEPEEPKLELGNVDQFFKKNEASFAENTDKPTNPPEFSNTTSEQMDPGLDHENKNNLPKNILSSPPIDINPHLIHRKVPEIVRMMNEEKGGVNHPN